MLFYFLQCSFIIGKSEVVVVSVYHCPMSSSQGDLTNIISDEQCLRWRWIQC